MRETSSQPARILVIEDNSADVMLLRHALDEHGEAYDLEVLQDGGDGLAFVAAQRGSPGEPVPCVMVLDLHLPKHDGVSILQALKKAPELHHVRVVALSSFVSPREEAQMRALGVRLCLEKPPDLDGWIALAGMILEICREPVGSPVFAG
ncbi:MAG TPA: response regulator [Bryobacteraceae bacterium]